MTYIWLYTAVPLKIAHNVIVAVCFIMMHITMHNSDAIMHIPKLSLALFSTCAQRLTFWTKGAGAS